jgi:(p)ppGpp synthase/HD superfamily hydrolase
MKNFLIHASVTNAIKYATVHHKHQNWGKFPYLHHLLNVHATLMHYLPTATLEQQVAAILHDVVEDTDATLEDVEYTFGGEVSGLVHALTNRVKGDNALKNSLAKLSVVPDAIPIKCADRMVNALKTTADLINETAPRSINNIRKRYLAEHEAGYASLFEGELSKEMSAAYGITIHNLYEAVTTRNLYEASSDES